MKAETITVDSDYYERVHAERDSLRAQLSLMRGALESVIQDFERGDVSCVRVYASGTRHDASRTVGEILHEVNTFRLGELQAAMGGVK